MDTGTVVFSKRGRDKGRSFLVTASDNGYVYLCDGALRPLSKPKKKKIKHIQITNTVFDISNQNFDGGFKDSDIRKLLCEYNVKHRRGKRFA